jgi:hypothetical protein
MAAKHAEEHLHEAARDHLAHHDVQPIDEHQDRRPQADNGGYGQTTPKDFLVEGEGGS